MKIKVRESSVNDGFLIKLKRKRKLLGLSFLIVFVSLVIAYFVVGNLLKKRGYPNVWETSKSTVSNYIKSFGSSPDKMNLDVKLEDFKKLEQRRTEALKRGLIINDENSYVPAKIRFKGKEFEVKIRLKGHMTDHIEGSKWSFRVKVKDKEGVMGMKIFSLQHPGTRGYVYEWIYHKLMKQEGIVALRYHFLKLELNGKDLGVYALEENFDQELLEANNRPPGPIIRFNPDLYWVDRYHEILNDKTIAEYAEYQSANIEPYRTEKILADTAMRKLFIKAQSLMEGFRTGKLKAGEVFDIEKVARFHAIIDLVGGHHSLDWSDIKYYLNSKSGLLEPVAYESFTLFPVKRISGSYNYRPSDKDLQNNFHKSLFSDRVFFEAYINSLERMSAPGYLKSFFEKNSEDLEKNLSILYREFPYKDFEEEFYYRNQRSIRQILDPPKAFHAFVSSLKETSLMLRIGSIESLPVEIKKITLGDKTLYEGGKTLILESKLAGQPVSYDSYTFELSAPVHDSLVSRIKLIYSVLGSAAEKESEVFPYDIISDTETHSHASLTRMEPGPFYTVDDSLKLVIMKTGSIDITKNMEVPPGYKLVINEGTTVNLIGNASIISFSPVTCRGSEEFPVVVESQKKDGGGIYISSSTERSVFSYCIFRNLSVPSISQKKLNGSVNLSNTSASFFRCGFSDLKSEEALSVREGNVQLNKCSFDKLQNDALDFKNSRGVIINTTFNDVMENAVDATASYVSLKRVNIRKAGDKAINVKAGSTIEGTEIRIFSSSVAISGEDLSVVSLKDVSITDCNYGILAFTNKKKGGCSDVTIDQLALKGVPKEFIVEECSVLKVNGKTIREKVKDAEKLVR